MIIMKIKNRIKLKNQNYMIVFLNNEKNLFLIFQI